MPCMMTVILLLTSATSYAGADPGDLVALESFDPPAVPPEPTEEEVFDFMDASLKSSPALHNSMLAPPAPEWPKGLAPPCDTQGGDCPRREWMERDGAICLSRPLMFAMDQSLSVFDVYPSECQRRITKGWRAAEEINSLCQKSLNKLPPPPEGGSFQDWQVAIAVVGAVAVGFGLGFGSYALTH